MHLSAPQSIVRKRKLDWALNSGGDVAPEQRVMAKAGNQGQGARPSPLLCNKKSCCIVLWLNRGRR